MHHRDATKAHRDAPRLHPDGYCKDDLFSHHSSVAKLIYLEISGRRPSTRGREFRSSVQKVHTRVESSQAAGREMQAAPCHELLLLKVRMAQQYEDGESSVRNDRLYSALLHAAVMKGDAEAVSALLKEGGRREYTEQIAQICAPCTSARDCRLDW